MFLLLCYRDNIVTGVIDIVVVVVVIGVVVLVTVA